jgi:hypothetical protein
MVPASTASSLEKCKMAELLSGFDCRICGKHHSTLPLSFSVKAPLAATRIPHEEIESRVVLNADQCVIDGKEFFLRGRIVVPIADIAEPFIWGVWAEVGPKDFIRTQKLWKMDGREFEPTFRGWLDTDLPLFEATVNLEVRVQTQVVGRRPHFEIVSELHSLGREQRVGITLLRAQEIAESLLHAQATPDGN